MLVFYPLKKSAKAPFRSLKGARRHAEPADGCSVACVSLDAQLLLEGRRPVPLGDPPEDGADSIIFVVVCEILRRQVDRLAGSLKLGHLIDRVVDVSRVRVQEASASLKQSAVVPTHNHPLTAPWVRPLTM